MEVENTKLIGIISSDSDFDDFLAYKSLFDQNGGVYIDEAGHEFTLNLEIRPIHIFKNIEDEMVCCLQTIIEFQRLGIELVALACPALLVPENFDLLKEEVKKLKLNVKLMHMVAELSRYLIKDNFKGCLGVVCGNYCIESGVFDILKPLFPIVYLDAALRDRMDQFKESTVVHKESKQHFSKEVMDNLFDKGASLVINTSPSFFDADHEYVSVINPFECLMSSIQHYYELNRVLEVIPPVPGADRLMTYCLY